MGKIGLRVGFQRGIASLHHRIAALHRSVVGLQYGIARLHRDIAALH